MVDDDIRTFLAIAKQGTVVAAARALDISEPDFVSRAESLRLGRGARMLRQTDSGYELTEAGQATLTRFEWIKSEVLAAERFDPR